jgi:2-C-methyl-D-erythritol 4-phosphate cytidylyltransferase
VHRESRLSAVVVAAGTSERMAGVNKLFAALGGKPLLAWSVDTCHHCVSISQIILVLNGRDLRRGRMLKEKRGWARVTLCSGGARRQDSVKAGLKHLRNCDLVMIHDGARPFLTEEMILRGFQMARETGAAVAAVPVSDTIKLVADKRAAETLPRDSLWAAQTPQMFSVDLITRAYEDLPVDVTDDGAAVERLGVDVPLFSGDHRNIKVTTPQDLSLARIIARNG